MHCAMCDSKFVNRPKPLPVITAAFGDHFAAEVCMILVTLEAVICCVQGRTIAFDLSNFKSSLFVVPSFFFIATLA